MAASGATLDRMRALADRLGDVGRADSCGRSCASLDVDLQQVLLHERADESRLQPEIAPLVGGHDPLSAISRTHREIAHLGRRFSRYVADLPEQGPTRRRLIELRRILYALEAILRLHFAQEDEIYDSVAAEPLHKAALPG